MTTFSFDYSIRQSSVHIWCFFLYVYISWRSSVVYAGRLYVFGRLEREIYLGEKMRRRGCLRKKGFEKNVFGNCVELWEKWWFDFARLKGALIQVEISLKHVLFWEGWIPSMLKENGFKNYSILWMKSLRWFTCLLIRNYRPNSVDRLPCVVPTEVLCFWWVSFLLWNYCLVCWSSEKVWHFLFSGSCRRRFVFVSKLLFWDISVQLLFGNQRIMAER